MSNDRQRQDLQDIFITHRDRLQGVARQIVGTRDAAEDVVQSAYLRVVDASSHLVVQQPSSYCFQVVRYLAIDHVRRRTLESQLFGAEVEGQAVPAPHCSPEQTAISGESLALIEQALARLPSRTRQAFVWYRMEGMTQRKIADRLGVSATLVNFMIRDAVEALKQCRQPAGEQG